MTSLITEPVAHTPVAQEPPTTSSPDSPFVKHRLGGWLPTDPNHYYEWLRQVARDAESSKKYKQALYDNSVLHPTVKALWDLIESNREVRMWFDLMLKQVPNSKRSTPTGGIEFKDWTLLLAAFDAQLYKGPVWLYNTQGQQGLIGFPFNAILDWPMATAAGYALFLREDVNALFRNMLNAYGDFLKSPASVSVLNNTVDGWLNGHALQTMAVKADPTLSFAQVYECDPLQPSFGFTSWDSFFTRKFRDGVRPVFNPQDDDFIVNCCESGPYALVTKAKASASFWLKGQPYSLNDIFADAAAAAPFVGGTVYQAFLSALSYHCWHAPISGTVISVTQIPGTYYAENYFEGFAYVDENGNPVTDPQPDPEAPNDSQGYICQVATRSVCVIEADNPKIGRMAIVQIGMAEVSTCEWFVKPGQHISKGELVGTFHFGGSTHCLIFGPGVQLEFEKPAQPPYDPKAGNLPVCGALAKVL